MQDFGKKNDVIVIIPHGISSNFLPFNDFNESEDKFFMGIEILKINLFTFHNLSKDGSVCVYIIKNPCPKLLINLDNKEIINDSVNFNNCYE